MKWFDAFALRIEHELNWFAVKTRPSPLVRQSPYVVPSKTAVATSLHEQSRVHDWTRPIGALLLDNDDRFSVAEAERGSLEPIIKDEVVYYRHQIDGIRYLATLKNFLLADDMGLGKSLQALTVFATDVYRDWARTCIVVCPLTLVGNWEDEISKFTRIPYMKLRGTPKERIDILTEFAAIPGFKILIVNYEGVKANLTTLNALKFDVAIFDEAHYIKNPKSSRTKACQALLSKRSFLLTGTPMLNHVNELWTLLNRIDPAFYPDYYKFVNRYCVFGGYKEKSVIGVKNERQLKEQLSKIMVRRLKKNVLDLPEVQIIERRVDLTEQQQELYDRAENEMDLPDPSSASPTIIQNSLTLFLRLKQIAGGTFPFTGEDHSSKLDLCIEDDLEILENGNKIIVFTQFLGVQDRYVARAKVSHSYPVFVLNGSVKAENRQPLVNEWAAVKGPAIIVAMLQVAGVGLNMVASRHLAFLDELFVPGLNQQAIDRAHRIGASKTQPVQVRRYIARKTKDARIQAILNSKRKLFDDVIENEDDAWKIALREAATEDE